MQTQRNLAKIWVEWTAATLIGYIVGILAILPWMINFAYSEQESSVSGLIGGAVLGAVLGLGQWLILRRYTTHSLGWIVLTLAGATLGLAVGVWLGEILPLNIAWTAARGAPGLPWIAIVQSSITGAMLGIGLGGAQWLLLRRTVNNAAFWIVGNAVAWLLALALGAAFTESIGVLGALFVTGLTGGLITGLVLQKLLQTARTSPPALRFAPGIE